MYYDTHCHPYLSNKKSQENILENFFTGGGKYMNTIGCDIESSKKSVQIARDNSGVFATIGIHPTHTIDYRDSLEKTMIELENIYHKNSDYIVAIGEIGLDYYWLDSLYETHNLSKNQIVEIQKEFFIAQIHLAKKLGLPIVIHNRESSNDILQILKETGYKKFVFHCYSEDMDYAKKLLHFSPDCMLGFGGVITFKNTDGVQETVKKIPLNNIIIETDSPYLTPSPYRGKEENEPIYCKYILSKIIDLRGESSKIISEKIFQNSLDFFGIN